MNLPPGALPCSHCPTGRRGEEVRQDDGGPADPQPPEPGGRTDVIHRPGGRGRGGPDPECGQSAMVCVRGPGRCGSPVASLLEGKHGRDLALSRALGPSLPPKVTWLWLPVLPIKLEPGRGFIPAWVCIQGPQGTRVNKEAHELSTEGFRPRAGPGRVPSRPQESDLGPYRGTHGFLFVESSAAPPFPSPAYTSRRVAGAHS